MREMTKINYAVQRQMPNLSDWDTIRTSITPHEARARRLMRWQQSRARGFSSGSLRSKLRQRSYLSKSNDIFGLPGGYGVAQVCLTPFIVSVALRPLIQNSTPPLA